MGGYLGGLRPFQDNNGTMWFGGGRSGTLYKLDHTEKGERFIPYTNDSPSEVTFWNLTRIYEDRSGNLWIGTMGGGLFGLLREESQERGLTERFIRYTMEDGLPSNTVHGILDDDHGNLWIATKDGFCRFDPAVGEFMIYDESDGLPVRNFPWLSGHKGKNGEMFFSAEG